MEQPLPSGGGNPAIKAAPLPVGGNDEGGPCLHVSWSGDSIPDGVGVMITSVDFESDAYQQADNSCDSPPCVGHILRSSDTNCFVPIKPTDPAATDRDQDNPVSVTVNGYVVCADANGADCTSFKAAVSQQPGSLTVARPIVPGAASPDTGSGSGSDATPQSTSESPGG